MVILLLDAMKHLFRKMDGQSAEKAQSFREDLVLLDYDGLSEWGANRPDDRKVIAVLCGKRPTRC
jgi:hypothetical protein